MKKSEIHFSFAKKCWRFLSEILRLNSGAEVCKSCRSRQELSNEYLLAKNRRRYSRERASQSLEENSINSSFASLLRSLSWAALLGARSPDGTTRQHICNQSTAVIWPERAAQRRGWPAEHEDVLARKRHRVVETTGGRHLRPYYHNRRRIDENRFWRPSRARNTSSFSADFRSPAGPRLPGRPTPTSNR